MNSRKNGFSRRKFIQSALALSSGALAGGMAGGRVSSALARTVNEGDLEVDLAAYDELKQDGGFKVIKEVQIGDISDNIIIVRKSESTYLVFSAICRHKKCNVKFKTEKEAFVCPCHGSTYDLTGKVVKGPSTGDLPAYKSRLSGGKLFVSAS